MKRLEYLLCAIFDGRLTLEEELELTPLIKENSEFVKEMLRLEVSLRGMQKNNEISKKVIRKIENESACSMSDSVISQILQEENKEKVEIKKYKSSKFNFFSAIAASFIAVCAILFFSIPSNTVGKIVLSSKGATIIRGDRVLKPENFSNLKIGDIIQTKDDFSLAYEDNTLIDIEKNSKVIIKGDKWSDAKKIFLEHGAIYATVKPQNTNKPFEIETNNGTVEVVGTKFNLQAEKDYSKIRVTKGKVLFGENKKIALNAGEAAYLANNKIIPYGIISNEDYLNMNESAVYAMDFSQKQSDKIQIKKELYHTIVNFENPPIIIDANMKVNITFIKNNKMPFEIGLINSSVNKPNEKNTRVGVILNSKNCIYQENKLQTITLPIKQAKLYYENLDEIIEQEYKEKLQNGENLFPIKHIRMQQKKGNKLEIKRIWITNS